MTASLLPKTEEVHLRLLALLKKEDAISAAITELRVKLAEQDKMHDHLRRGTYLSFQAQLYWSEGESQKAMERLFKLIFPEQLSIINATYMDTYGAGEALAFAIGESEREQLSAIQLPNGESMRSAIDQIITLTRQMGEHLNQIKQLELESSSTQEAVTLRGELYQARRQWQQMARALESNAQLAGLGEEALGVLFGELG